jgi:adenylate kinase
MRVVFVGPPGSGKGTQAKRLQEREGLLCIGTGDILRAAVHAGTELGKKAAGYMLKGELVPDDVVNAVIADLFDRPDHPERFVMDGYPRTLSQAIALDRILGERGVAIDTVINFQIPDDVVVSRLVNGPGRGRSDDNEATVIRRLFIDKQNAGQIVEYYRKKGILFDVKGIGTEDEVFASIVRVLKSRPN